MKTGIIFLGIVLLISCEKSALDDIELDDASLLTQNIMIREQRDYNIKLADQGMSKKEIYVKIRDKNNKAVKLLNGKVSAEGQTCDFGKPDPLLARDTYYVENFVPKDGDADYKVTVELANGKVYNTTIGVPAFFDSKIAVDTAAYEITWPKSRRPGELYLTISFEDETGMHTAYSPAATTPDTGIFDYTDIADSFPKIANNSYSKLIISLWRKSAGTLTTSEFREDTPYKIEMTHNVSIFGKP